MSTFAGLNTVITALWAQRQCLNVTGQNIANVNTDGYSRQRTDLQAIGGAVVPAFYSTSRGVGQGVSANDVIRIRDAFLEGRAHTEHANHDYPAHSSGGLDGQLVNYGGVIEQALRDLARWLEEGVAPPVSTRYNVAKGRPRSSCPRPRRSGLW